MIKNQFFYKYVTENNALFYIGQSTASQLHTYYLFKPGSRSK